MSNHSFPIISTTHSAVEVIFKTNSKDDQLIMWRGKIDSEYLALGIKNRNIIFRLFMKYLFNYCLNI